jgi:hypothetical protein
MGFGPKSQRSTDMLVAARLYVYKPHPLLSSILTKSFKVSSPRLRITKIWLLDQKAKAYGYMVVPTRRDLHTTTSPGFLLWLSISKAFLCNKTEFQASYDCFLKTATEPRLWWSILSQTLHNPDFMHLFLWSMQRFRSLQFLEFMAIHVYECCSKDWRGLRLWWRQLVSVCIKSSLCLSCPQSLQRIVKSPSLRKIGKCVDMIAAPKRTRKPQ